MTGTDDATMGTDDAPTPGDPAATRRVRPRLRWVRILVLVVVLVAIVVVAVVVVPEVLKPRRNGVACSEFESGYNTYVRVLGRVHAGNAESTTLPAAQGKLVDRVDTAKEKASGDVAAALTRSAAAAAAYADSPGSTSATVKFFTSATRVVHACAADGSDITLRQLG